jgi:hypothetical protein
MKTAFERWVEANQNLVKCFEGIQAERWKNMSQSE